MQSNFETRAATLLSQNKGKININWVLLDSQSTVDMFSNPHMLSNIRVASETVDIHCNAGMRTVNMIGDLNGYGTIWFDPKGIANILSLHRVIDRHHVQFDSRSDNNFIV